MAESAFYSAYQESLRCQVELAQLSRPITRRFAALVGGLVTAVSGEAIMVETQDIKTGAVLCGVGLVAMAGSYIGFQKRVPDYFEAVDRVHEAERSLYEVAKQEDFNQVVTDCEREDNPVPGPFWKYV